MFTFELMPKAIRLVASCPRCCCSRSRESSLAHYPPSKHGRVQQQIRWVEASRSRHESDPSWPASCERTRTSPSSQQRLLATEWHPRGSTHGKGQQNAEPSECRYLGMLCPGHCSRGWLPCARHFRIGNPQRCAQEKLLQCCWCSQSADSKVEHHTDRPSHTLMHHRDAALNKDTG